MEVNETPEEQEPERDTETGKLKKHFKENRDAYIATGIVFVSGIIVGVVGYKLLGHRMPRYPWSKTPALAPENVAEVAVQNINCNIKYQVISKYGHKIGHPGNTIREITEGVTTPDFASQTLAALDAGVSVDRMSKHLKGEIPHLNGRKFVRIEG